MLTRFLRLVACLGLLALPTLLGPDPGRAATRLASITEAGAVAYGPSHDAGPRGEAFVVHAGAAAHHLGYRPGGARQKAGESPRPGLSNSIIPVHRPWFTPSSIAGNPARAPQRPRETRRSLPLLI